jgi:hypothetical protein
VHTLLPGEQMLDMLGQRLHRSKILGQTFYAPGSRVHAQQAQPDLLQRGHGVGHSRLSLITGGLKIPSKLSAFVVPDTCGITDLSEQGVHLLDVLAHALRFGPELANRLREFWQVPSNSSGKLLKESIGGDRYRHLGGPVRSTARECLPVEPDAAELEEPLADPRAQ